MKFRMFDKRGKFSPLLSCGKPMWTTTDGQQTHYEREYQMWFNSKTYGNKHQVQITPSIIVNLWDKCSLTSIMELGMIAHSCGIGIRFWTWYGDITFMRALNTKTTKEVNKSLEENGFQHRVL